MIRTLLSLGSIVFVVAAVAAGTNAFFGDTESSTGNTFSAGAIDLKIDNESYYNGAFNDGTSWELKDLGEGDFFFNFLDLKPDDEGEDTISLHIDNNDAWACMDIEIVSADENGCTEPEGLEDESCGEPGLDEGELQSEVNFVWWHDDGDNVLEDDEVEEVFSQTSLGALSQSIVLADSNEQGILSEEGPLEGGTDYFIGKAWCFGELTVNAVDQDGLGKTGTNGPLERGTGITCDGSGLGNETQTDSVVGNISFTAVQSRNNPGFVCNEDGGLGCTEEADVMIVLDRSGSINETELAELKTSAKAFVDALDPDADGVHVGLASFSTLGTLDVHLTDDGAAVKAAIDSMTVSGFTNLFEGLEQAHDELENADGDLHDRDDSSSPDFIVLITDGEPNEPGNDSQARDAATTEAGLARGNGIEIFAVGVGISNDAADFLSDNIVSAPANTHYFDSEDFAELQGILGELAICEEAGGQEQAQD